MEQLTKDIVEAGNLNDLDWDFFKKHINTYIA